jgi:membrane-bound lytic murein transglycosylase F
MQVMPMTGRKYGIDDLVNPENNLIAGTSHLKRLQKMFEGKGFSQDEIIRFTLAAYNAGEGRIMDCRNLAAAQGLDNRVWTNIVKVIPMMREDAILEDEAVKLGKFQGHETIAYVENIQSLYNAICAICPAS